MASFPICTTSQGRVLSLERKGFLPPQAESGWRLEDIGRAPDPHGDEVVVLVPFYEHGFGLPLHPFVRGLLFFYGLEIQHLNPNAILHMACFIMLCEAFLGIAPHFKLWCYLFWPQLLPGQGGQSFVDGVAVQLRNSRKQDYLQILLPSSSHGYAGEWFYVQKLGDPPLANGGQDKRYANQVELLLGKIYTLRRHGLTGTKLVHTFLHRRVQPLWLRQHGVWGYIDIGDLDRSSTDELAPEEVRSRLVTVTEGTSSAPFAGGPLALNHSIKSDLGLGNLKPSIAPLPEDAAVKADRKRKRDADACAKEEREKCHQRVHQQKLVQRAQRAKERGDSPTPPTDPSDEEWSSDATSEAVPLVDSSHPDTLPEALLVMDPPGAQAWPPLSRADVPGTSSNDVRGATSSLAMASTSGQTASAMEGDAVVAGTAAAGSPDVAGLVASPLLGTVVPATSVEGDASQPSSRSGPVASAASGVPPSVQASSPSGGSRQRAALTGGPILSASAAHTVVPPALRRPFSALRSSRYVVLILLCRDWVS
ncbi:hypothetical protein BS78_09G097600 [Paspalum vaginatum]|nr:hypothetical protein BS78_09G097600 [Paspalum vaginatum]